MPKTNTKGCKGNTLASSRHRADACPRTPFPLGFLRGGRSHGDRAGHTAQRQGTGSCPYLVVGLNVPHQDGQVLDAQVHVVVHVLVDALICRPGVSRGRNTRREMASPNQVPFVLSKRRLTWRCDECGSSHTLILPPPARVVGVRCPTSPSCPPPSTQPTTDP